MIDIIYPSSLARVSPGCKAVRTAASLWGSELINILFSATGGNEPQEGTYMRFRMWDRGNYVIVAHPKTSRSPKVVSNVKFHACRMAPLLRLNLMREGLLRYLLQFFTVHAPLGHLYKLDCKN